MVVGSSMNAQIGVILQVYVLHTIVVIVIVICSCCDTPSTVLRSVTYTWFGADRDIPSQVEGPWTQLDQAPYLVALIRGPKTPLT